MSVDELRAGVLTLEKCRKLSLRPEADSVAKPDFAALWVGRGAGQFWAAVTSLALFRAGRCLGFGAVSGAAKSLAATFRTGWCSRVLGSHYSCSPGRIRPP